MKNTEGCIFVVLFTARRADEASAYVVQEIERMR